MINDGQNNCLATVFLFYQFILKWSMIQSTYVSFQRISGARYTSELGTLQVNYEQQCVHACSITPNCSSVSFDRTNKRCDMASSWIDTEQTVVSPDWEVLYREDYPICSSGSCFKVNNARLTWRDANTYPMMCYTRCLTSTIPCLRPAKANKRRHEHTINCSLIGVEGEHTDFCQAQHPGGHLAHIKTESDMTLLISLTTKYVWIGAVDTDTEGVFTWTDNTLVSAAYTNWIPGQPDDYKGEDCLMVLPPHRNNKWNDADCNTPQRSVCQFPASTGLLKFSSPELGPQGELLLHV